MDEEALVHWLMQQENTKMLQLLLDALLTGQMQVGQVIKVVQQCEWEQGRIPVVHYEWREP
jgi:DNA recombination-dependent growth factor C